MSTILQYTGRLVIETCCNCAMSFAVPEDFRARRLNDHATFYCPVGHRQYYYGKSVAEKLRDELAREKHRAEQARADAIHQRERRESAERSSRAYRGVATRIKKRIKHGVCPCCNRTFANVAAHIETKHPHFAATPEEQR